MSVRKLYSLDGTELNSKVGLCSFYKIHFMNGWPMLSCKMFKITMSYFRVDWIMVDLTTNTAK